MAHTVQLWLNLSRNPSTDRNLLFDVCRGMQHSGEKKFKETKV